MKSTTLFGSLEITHGLAGLMLGAATAFGCGASESSGGEADLFEGGESLQELIVQPSFDACGQGTCTDEFIGKGPTADSPNICAKRCGTLAATYEEETSVSGAVWGCCCCQY